MRVVAFARDLDHPRWLLVLPNGDVLVAETNAPPRPDDGKGIKAWLTGLVMKRAGAAVPSANRITVLRDTDGDGMADQRSVLLEGLNSPFGMALLGDNLYVANTAAVRDGAFYGWPYSYYGQHVDQRVTPQRPEWVARAIAPDFALGPHTASLGLAWSGGNSLPSAFAQGMFVGQHGSWNRRPHSGYKVIFVPFDGGRPADVAPLDVLTGFLSQDGQAMGRPVGVALDQQGALLVADDVGNVVWRVSAQR